jgi:oligopeptide/dipeptide ABC transporter ATP-binding protein
MAVLLISHDLGVIAKFARRVVVMYAGRIVEDAPVDVLLMASMPPLEGGANRLYAIPGRIPDPDEPIPGCRFGPRCPHLEPVCRTSAPELVAISETHRVRCTPRARPGALC